MKKVLLVSKGCQKNTSINLYFPVAKILTIRMFLCHAFNTDLRGMLKKCVYLFVYISVVAFQIVDVRYYALGPAHFPNFETLPYLDFLNSL